jgi:hypothetical protein
VDAQEAAERRAQGARGGEQVLARIRAALPTAYLERYEVLRTRVLELRQITRELHVPAAEGAAGPLEDFQGARLDRLLWIYLRLLYTEWSLQRFFQRTNEEDIRDDAERLGAQRSRIEKEPAGPARDKALKAVDDNLETSRARLENLARARENLELLTLEIDRLENKIRSLSEMAVNRQEPDFISDQVDAVASSMVEAERTMNELQFATGFTAGEEQVPPLLSRAPEASEEAEARPPAPRPRMKERR